MKNNKMWTFKNTAPHSISKPIHNVNYMFSTNKQINSYQFSQFSCFWDVVMCILYFFYFCILIMHAMLACYIWNKSWMNEDCICINYDRNISTHKHCLINKHNYYFIKKSTKNNCWNSQRRTFLEIMQIVVIFGANFKAKPFFHNIHNKRTQFIQYLFFYIFFYLWGKNVLKMGTALVIFIQSVLI